MKKYNVQTIWCIDSKHNYTQHNDAEWCYAECCIANNLAYFLTPSVTEKKVLWHWHLDWKVKYLKKEREDFIEVF
jgi:hypothetical protein